MSLIPLGESLHAHHECLLPYPPGRTAATFDAAIAGSLCATHESMSSRIKIKDAKNAFCRGFASGSAARRARAAHIFKNIKKSHHTAGGPRIVGFLL